MVKSVRYVSTAVCERCVGPMYFTCCHLCRIFRMRLLLSPQYATRRFSDNTTNPTPERTWSLSSKEVNALSHAIGSDYVYALTENEVSE